MQPFLPLLKYIVREVPPALLMDSALASSGSILDWLELALSDMGANSGIFSQRPLCSPTATKTLPHKPIQDDTSKILGFWRDCLHLLEKHHSLSPVSSLTSLRVGSRLRWASQEKWGELREEEHAPFTSVDEVRLHLQEQ